MVEKIKSLIRGKGTCVLATATDGEPHSSLMSYVADDDGTIIYMISLKGTRKYENLLENPRVSLLFDTRDESVARDRRNVRAVTARGIFQPIADGATKRDVLAKLLARHPQLRELADRPESEIFQVKMVSFELLEGVSEAYFFDRL